MKKRFVSIFLGIVLFMSTDAFTVRASQPSAKEAYESLSSRFIDGAYVPTYEVDGEVCIIAEDLVNYGYNVEWNEKDRIVTISDGERKIYTYTDLEELAKVVERMTQLNKFTYQHGTEDYSNNSTIISLVQKQYGDKIPEEIKSIIEPNMAFTIHSSDIKVIYNDREIQSYSTNGNMLIPFGDFFYNELSVQNGDYKWRRSSYPENKNVELTGVYLSSFIEGEGIPYSRGHGEDKGKYAPRDSLGILKYASTEAFDILYGNILQLMASGDITLGEFSDYYLNGLFMRNSYSEWGAKKSDTYTAGNYVNSVLNGESNSVTMIGQVLDVWQLHSYTVYASGEYEDGELKNGVKVVFNFGQTDEQGNDIPLDDFELILYEVNDFESTEYFKSTFDGYSTWRFTFF